MENKVTEKDNQKKPTDVTEKDNQKKPSDVTEKDNQKKPSDVTEKDNQKKPSDVTEKDNQKKPSDVTEKDNEKKPSVMVVEEINKRSLGKFIIQCLGNEGANHDEENQLLRRQIQTCIEEIENYTSDVWRNAIVNLISIGGQEYTIYSGKQTHKFMIFIDSEDKIRFVKMKTGACLIS